MRFSTIVYEFKQGFKNIARNWMFSLASIITMAACIFIFGVFFSIVTNVNHMVHAVEENVAVTVYFEEGTTDEVMQKVGEEIAARSEVAESKFVSAEEAWEDYKEQYFEDSEDAAEGFKDDNPLANSAHYDVYVNNIEEQNALVSYVEGLEGVRQVNQSESAVTTLVGVNKLVVGVSVSVIAILLLVAVFLISNTVSVGISIRKEEIAIMKLIGATNFFVRAPFTLEGMILGFVGAAIPLGVLYLGYSQVVTYILSKFTMLTDIVQFIPVNEIFTTLLPVGLVLGMGIGFLGSVFTTRKHLNV